MSVSLATRGITCSAAKGAALATRGFVCGGGVMARFLMVLRLRVAELFRQQLQAK